VATTSGNKLNDDDEDSDGIASATTFHETGCSTSSRRAARRTRQTG
jgi:hypothetical protein